MRFAAGPAIILVGLFSIAGAARAAERLYERDAALVMNAAFADRTAADPGSTDQPASLADPGPSPRTVTADAIGDLLAGQERAYSGWSSGAFVIGGASTPTGLRISVGGPLTGRDGRSLLSAPVAPADLRIEPRSYEVAVTRDWPGAVSLTGRIFDLDLTPHAGLGMTSQGGSAEAGATLTVAQGGDDLLGGRLARLGVQDGAAFGDKGRWYLFAAASGRAVGLNFLKDQGAGWDRSWSSDAASTLVSDAQLGVGWRRGSVQTSLGYLHREVKGDHMLWGQEAKDDSLVAFSLSIKPRN